MSASTLRLSDSANTLILFLLFWGFEFGLQPFQADLNWFCEAFSLRHLPVKESPNFNNCRFWAIQLQIFNATWSVAQWKSNSEKMVNIFNGNNHKWCVWHSRLASLSKARVKLLLCELSLFWRCHFVGFFRSSTVEPFVMLSMTTFVKWFLRGFLPWFFFFFFNWTFNNASLN